MRHVRASVLSSGSSGNSVYVETDDTAILIDCGVTVPALKARLTSIGRDLAKIQAIFVTHDHGDHVGSSVALARRQKIPVYATTGTHSILRRLDGLAKTIRADIPINCGPFEVLPIATPHDGIESVAFRVVEHSSRGIGVVTDLGYVTRQLIDRLSGVQTLVAEHNHDERMLMEGPYPRKLKERIRSGHGHLSNAQGADMVAAFSHTGLNRVILAHLSETNNTPQLAQLAYEKANGVGRELVIAQQWSATPLFEV
jgi:phosphoribosyl 1,2-cyclic phosphodiesterase